jgi:hypothetical protein
MRRFRLILLTLVVAAIAPATASAACPSGPGTVWVDYAAYAVYNTPVENVLAQPGTLLGVQNPKWRDSYQAKGADTVGWYMRLLSIVGTVNDPKPRSQVLAKVPHLAQLARDMTSCTTPWLTLNEMQAVQIDEPASYNQRRFRANVLTLAKALDNRGVRVLLLMPRIPLDNTRYRAYWRELSRHADLVYEAYTWSTLTVNRLGDAAARAYMRGKWTDAMRRLKRFVVSMNRAGIVIPYWSRPARSPTGREHLSDARWFRAVRLRTLAVKDVAGNMGLGTVWSWGWQTNPKVGEVDPDKPRAACYYLQARDPSLCDPATL